MPTVRVMGVVPNKPVAEQVIGNCRLAGFPQGAVSFIVIEPDEASKLDQAAADQTGKGVKRTFGGIGRGAVIGLVLGLIGGFVIHAIPFFGTILPLGVFLGLFGGVGIIVGALAGSFSTENNTGQVIERYGMELRAGEAIVSIEAPDTDSAKTAEEILNNCGAAKVNSFLATEENMGEVVEEVPGVTEVKPRA
jgi:hypothetical protein